MERLHNDELTGSMLTTRRGCVVIVNSDERFARVLEAYLPLQGWSIVVCSAREALRDFRALRPSGLILDFDGPGLDAYDLLDALELERSPLATRVIVCSHYPEPVEPERECLRELGVTTWVRRPCSLAQIARALDDSSFPAAASGIDATPNGAG